LGGYQYVPGKWRMILYLYVYTSPFVHL
jgi:hypothetical protein